VVSLLTDVSSEMIYPLLPVFLTATLGASASMLGAIEGAAESTSSLLRLASGWWSDRVKRRTPLIVAGYAIATAMRPLVAIAQSATQVLAIRVTDRVGKGIRSSPRDALIADSVDPSIRGRAFGFHRAMDHAGAFAGPLIAFALLNWAGVELRTVFWLAAIPGAIAVVVLIAFVKERADQVEAKDAKPQDPVVLSEAKDLPKSFWTYLAIVFVFTLGSSADAFLILRANQLGVPVTMIVVLWAAHSAVKSLTSTWGGAQSDRFGRVPMMIAGWVVYALVYVGFAQATRHWHAWLLFLLYGLYFAFTEGAEKALIADLVPASRRGAAFGWFHLTIGLGALPASLVFGLIWDRAGAQTAFLFGAAVAVAATMALALFATLRRT
jgi:MFS family permease